MFIVAALAFATSCKNVNFKKTKSGLAYKIFPAKGKDSLIREGNIVKFNYSFKFNDSVMDALNSYGKMPGFIPVQALPSPTYDFQELLPMMKKGDSAVLVMMADTLLTKPQQMRLLPPHAKKGDRLTMTVKIIEVFTTDSTARADYTAELAKDEPRRQKEMEDEMAKASTKGVKDMEDFLDSKNIKAQKTGKGTFVVIEKQGTGPAAELGKFVNVKYSGKFLETDSVFQSNSYAFQLGSPNSAIAGWEEGLVLFKQGGKGTLYIPGFLAYGSNPPQGSPFGPYEPLKFDIEVLEVSDKPIGNPGQ